MDENDTTDSSPPATATQGKTRTSSGDAGKPPSPPLGPDGKPIKFSTGPDGKPTGPPLDSEGKPLPPPPIIGPDGKEIPRPTDAQGRPLPVYVDKERKPVLDASGKPIPLHFDNAGKPIPLDDPKFDTATINSPTLYSNSRSNNIKKFVPSAYHTVVGVLDCVISLILLGTAAYYAHEIFNAPTFGLIDYTSSFAKMATIAGLHLVGVIVAIILIIGVKQGSETMYYAWVIVSMLILLVQIVVIALMNKNEPGFMVAVISLCFHIIRTLLACCSGLNYTGACSDASTQRGGVYSTQGYPTTSAYYNVKAPAGTQNTTTVIQQPVPYAVTVPSRPFGYGYGGGGYGYPYGGYGYPYGGGYGYGYGGGYPYYGGGYYGDAALLGLGVGLGMGAGYGYGYSPYWGGFGGYYDDAYWW